MGSVYLARDPSLGRLVAIKLIQAQLDSPELRRRFDGEARAVANLSHPHIVTVYDSGQFESRPYLVFEYIQGRSLGKVISGREPLDIEARLVWLDQLCDGLEFAHRAGIVHRDIKPANLMIDHLDRVKILDFGIARISGVARTTVSAAIGTPGYMAPEYIRGEEIDHRVDVFAAGAVAYELLTYRSAFPGETAATVIHRVLDVEPEPLRIAADPSIARELEQAVFTALRKNPDERFQNAGELRQALRAVRGALAREARPRAPGPSAGPPGGPRSGGGVAAQTPPSPDRALIDGDAVRKRRDSLVQKALTRARTELAAGRLDEALAACIEAATLDENRPETIEVTAQVRRAMDRREAESLLAQARAEIAHGDLDAAEDLLGAARALSADVPGAAALEDDIKRVRAERELARQRALELRSRIANARSALAADDLDGALASVRQALAIDPRATDAVDLSQIVKARLAARAEAERESLRARAAIAEARRWFSQGHHDEALAVLWSYKPENQEVTQAARELEARLEELRRLAGEAEAARLAAAARAAAQDDEATRHQLPRPADLDSSDEPTLLVRGQPAATVDPGAARPTPVPGEIAAPPTAAAQTAARETGRPLLEVHAQPARDAAPMARGTIAAGPAPDAARLLKFGAAGAAALALIVVAVLFLRRPAPSAQPSGGTPAAAAEPAAPVAAERSTPAGTPAPSPATVAVPPTSSPAPQTDQAAAPGALVLNAVPWAIIESITDASGAQRVRDRLYTPARISLPPGQYRVVLRNPIVNQAKTLDVVVRAGDVQTRSAEFDRVDAQQYFDRSPVR